MYTATIVAVDRRLNMFVVQVDGFAEIVTFRKLQVAELELGDKVVGPLNEPGRMRLVLEKTGKEFDAFAESGWGHRTFAHQHSN